MMDLSDARLAQPALQGAWRELRALYDLPFVLNRQHGSAVVVAWAGAWSAGC